MSRRLRIHHSIESVPLEYAKPRDTQRGKQKTVCTCMAYIFKIERAISRGIREVRLPNALSELANWEVSSAKLTNSRILKI